MVYLDLLWPSEPDESLSSPGSSVWSPTSGFTDTELLSTLVLSSIDVDETLKSHINNNIKLKFESSFWTAVSL